MNIPVLQQSLPTITKYTFIFWCCIYVPLALLFLIFALDPSVTFYSLFLLLSFHPVYGPLTFILLAGGFVSAPICLIRLWKNYRKGCYQRAHLMGFIPLVLLLLGIIVQSIPFE